MNDRKKVRVWDIPVRLFHWLLLVLVCISLYTGLNGGFNEMDYHMLSGYSILTLVIFRVLWGFFGSAHARFSSFLTLRGIPGYVRNILNRDTAHDLGHNPLGALSIIALLVILAVQAGTGLFANDDIMLEGPLTHLVSDELSDQLTTIHHFNLWLLYGLLGLHVLAIAFHELYLGERLVLPMVTGKKLAKDKPAEEATTSPPAVNLLKELTTAVALTGLAVAIVYWLVNHL